MNVLVSAAFRWWNAEAAYAATLVRLLREAGHGAWILAEPGTRNAEALAARGLEPIAGLRPWTTNPLHWPREVHRLRAFQREHRIDVVNVHRAADLPLHLAAARLDGLPLVRTRGGAQPERRSWVNRRLYGNWVAGVIASCDLIRRRLETRLGVPPARMRTIYYPAALPSLPEAPARLAGRERFLEGLGQPPDRFLLAVVGRIAPEKGHPALVAALERLRADEPRALLAILDKGNPGEAPHRAALEAEIARRGLSDAVAWLGFREDVREIMGWADVGVIPSVASEMNCRVAVEFLARGTPVVAFPTGALPEVVETGRSGWVTARPDPVELAEALAALAADPERLATLRRGAREAAERRFSEADFLKAHLDVLGGALATRHP